MLNPGTEVYMEEGSCYTEMEMVQIKSVDAELFHEAAIGKIAGEQLIKLMPLGLTEAEEQIINGFLRG